MELLTTSILTLLALYVIYSEPFKLPLIVKKNKKLSYILIIGLYLYYCQNNDVDGGRGALEGLRDARLEQVRLDVQSVITMVLVLAICSIIVIVIVACIVDVCRKFFQSGSPGISRMLVENVNR